ncbi:MAG: rhodanese-like domain-containing protein [Myxococcales bacterium]|nr:rhodanese-like domain-containing protein [Myxococcales bacterium]MCB9718470.1 rhodanese-like domain-containing protein [Myxococcales bacterium]
MQLSPGGTPEVDAKLVHANPCWFRLVDVREADELDDGLGAIDGVEHVPQREVVAEISGWSSEQPVVLVCRSGRRSGRLARELYERGVTNVASLTGGMLGWHEHGLPVVSGEEIPSWSPAGSEAVTMRAVTREDVEAHVGDRDRVRWTKAATLMLQGTQACVDGRDARAIVGTPGGDAGELVLALAASEAMSGRSFDADEVAQIFSAYLDGFGHFYLHSDDDALYALLDDLAHEHPDAGLPGHEDHEAAMALLRSPPPELREAVLRRLSDPRFVGCGHLRLMLQHPDQYGTRRELVAAVIEAFYRALWGGHPALELVVLHGHHHESAVLEVRLDLPRVRPYSRIPLVSPRLGDTELFVSHPQVAHFVRRQNASFLLEQVPLLQGAGLDEASFLARLDELADRQANATLGHLADGLPHYTVEFHGQAVGERGPHPEGIFEVVGPRPQREEEEETRNRP